MKKILLYALLLLVATSQTFGMWRVASRFVHVIAKKKQPLRVAKIITPMARRLNQKPFVLFRLTNNTSFVKRLQNPGMRFLLMSSAATSYFLIAHYHTACACGKEKTEQAMPLASLWHEYAQGKSLKRHAMTEHFMRDCKLHEHENALIPAHAPNEQQVRIATYNVHMWKDAKDVPTFNAIMDTIKHINADVLALQEAQHGKENWVKEALRKTGYIYFAEGQTIQAKDRFFGNIVASKYPFAAQPTVKTYDADKQRGTYEQRCYIKTQIKLPSDKQVTVYGTHLDVWDATENLRKTQLQELIQDIGSTQESCVIAADYNAIRKRDYQHAIGGKTIWDMLTANTQARTGKAPQTKALETLENHGFKDSFSQNNQHSPRYTVWSGTAVDFFYVNPQWSLPISRSYVYYSNASDHLPILMDVRV